MKKHYVSDLQQGLDVKQDVTLYGWLKSRRIHSRIIFLDIADSTGTIQAIFEKEKCAGQVWECIKNLTLESSVRVQGQLLQSV